MLPATEPHRGANVLTPEEISSREFLVSLRGYDRDEVAAFLRQVAEEQARLLQRVEELERELEAARRTRPEPGAAARGPIDPKEAFRLLGEETTRILVAAEESAQVIRQRAEERARQELETARREARDEVESARRTASKILADAERRRAAVAEDIRNLEAVRDAFLRDLRNAIKSAQGAMRGLMPASGNGGAALEAAVETAPAEVEEGTEEAPPRQWADRPVTATGAPTAEPAAEPGDTEVWRATVTAAPPAGEPVVETTAEEATEAEDAAAAAAPVPSGPNPRALREQSLATIRPAALRRVTRALQDLQNQVLDALHRGERDLDALLPDRERLAALADAGEEPLSDAYRAGLTDGAVLVDRPLPEDAGDPSRVPASVATFGAVLSHEVVANLKATLRAALDAGAPVANLSERVGEVFADLKGPVAEDLVDEHLTRIYSYGVLDAWRAVGITHKQWVAGESPRCPEEVRQRNVAAGALALDEHFPSGDVVPPAHAGCDCALLPG